MTPSHSDTSFFFLQAPEIDPDATPAGIRSCIEQLIEKYVGGWIRWVFWCADLGINLKSWFISFVSQTFSHFIGGYPIAVVPKGEVNGLDPPPLPGGGTIPGTVSSDPITGAPITVTVTRYKRNAKLGLWNMSYGINAGGGTTVQPASKVFSQGTATLIRDRYKDDGEHDDGDCASVMPSGCYTCIGGKRTPHDVLSEAACTAITDIVDGKDITNVLTHCIDTSRHLFESTLKGAH